MTIRNSMGGSIGGAACCGMGELTLTLLSVGRGAIQGDSAATLTHERLHLAGRRVFARPEALAVIRLAILKLLRLLAGDKVAVVVLVHDNHRRHRPLALGARSSFVRHVAPLKARNTGRSSRQAFSSLA